jgi:hypothetical protein
VASTSIHQASSLTNLNGKPLLVLTADTGHDATWQSAQDHMATMPLSGYAGPVLTATVCGVRGCLRVATQPPTVPPVDLELLIKCARLSTCAAYGCGRHQPTLRTRLGPHEQDHHMLELLRIHCTT